MDPALELAQVERLRAVRAKRHAGDARDAIDALQQAAAGTDNLLPRIRTAVKARCTLGEIAHALRDVYGEYVETPIL